MTLRKSLIATVAAAALATTAAFSPLDAAEFGKPELLHSWTRLQYEFSSPAAAQDYVSNEVYKKAVLAGVDVDRNGNVYVTTPRWLDARVPASLSLVVMQDGKPVLRPFPSREANSLDTPGAFRSVLGVEVDSRNRMWILDMGFVAGETQAPAGGQKLVVIDLDTGRELRRFEIPDALAGRGASFLNDLAIDEVNELAYISDSGNRSAPANASGIIVYDFRANTARRVLDRHPTTANDVSRPLTVNGEAVFPGQPLQVGINGIALTPDASRLYWGITTGDALYSAPTSVLRDPAASAATVAAAVDEPVRIGGGSDGLSVDTEGNVYVTNLGLNRLQLFDPRTKQLSTITEGEGFIWPDSISWDRQGRLHLSTNHINPRFQRRHEL